MQYARVRDYGTSQERLEPATKSLIMTTYYSYLEAASAPGTTSIGSHWVYKVIQYVYNCSELGLLDFLCDTCFVTIRKTYWIGPLRVACNMYHGLLQNTKREP
jgi:hypothetical protein